MCGIAGFIDPELDEHQSAGLIESMLKTIRHRGPDNSGHWLDAPVCLGHNRLSIIDITPSSHQPFLYEDIVLTYNGEIYNYIELREELRKAGMEFRTQSDTEVITAAYKAWGEDCVKHFVGMWAFALWDKKNKKLFCSRDRFGIKPFYYSTGKDKFYFGSEYKPLKLSPLFNKRLNHEQIYRGLQLGWITYEDETYYHCIKCLPQAHNLVFQKGKVSTYRYWDIDPEQQTDRIEGTPEKFRALFRESINIHMRSDTPVGGCLSGGLDSSAIASCVGKSFPDTPFNTFTIYYTGENGVDERPWAKSVTDRYKNLKPHYHHPSGAEIREHLDKMLYYFDVPPAGSSPLSQYFVMQLAAKEGMKVLLDGQGADEYLAGYNHSFYRYAADLIRGAKLGKLSKELTLLKKQQSYSGKKIADILLKSMLSSMMNENSLYRFEYRHYFPFLPSKKDATLHLKNFPQATKLNRFLYHQTFNSSLPSLLHNEDRNSMAFSIESRVPFLDHRLVEMAFALSNQYKYDEGWSKNILRKGLKGIIPDKITYRTDKKGFVTPGEVKWLRGPLKELVDDIDPGAMPMLNPDTTSKVIREYKSGANKHAKLMWRLTMLDLWLKRQ